MPAGTVKWFNARKGFGFITPTDSDQSGDVFVHHSAIVAEEDTFRSLNEGDEVEYEVGEGRKGPEAEKCRSYEEGPHPLPGNGHLLTARALTMIIAPHAGVTAAVAIQAVSGVAAADPGPHWWRRAPALLIGARNLILYFLQPCFFHFDLFYAIL